MNELRMQHTPGPPSGGLRSSPAIGFASPPSFARALRQRGLLVTPAKHPGTAGAEPPADGSWMRALSVYDAHLRREAMEQAFAALRGEPGPADR